MSLPPTCSLPAGLSAVHAHFLFSAIYFAGVLLSIPCGIPAVLSMRVPPASSSPYYPFSACTLTFPATHYYCLLDTVHACHPARFLPFHHSPYHHCLCRLYLLSPGCGYHHLCCALLYYYYLLSVPIPWRPTPFTTLCCPNVTFAIHDSRHGLLPGSGSDVAGWWHPSLTTVAALFILPRDGTRLPALPFTVAFILRHLFHAHLPSHYYTHFCLYGLYYTLPATAATAQRDILLRTFYLVYPRTYGDHICHLDRPYIYRFGLTPFRPSCAFVTFGAAGTAGLEALTVPAHSLSLPLYSHLMPVVPCILLPHHCLPPSLKHTLTLFFLPSVVALRFYTCIHTRTHTGTAAHLCPAFFLYFCFALGSLSPSRSPLSCLYLALPATYLLSHLLSVFFTCAYVSAFPLCDNA